MTVNDHQVPVAVLTILVGFRRVLPGLVGSSVGVIMGRQQMIMCGGLPMMQSGRVFR
jgi:hypothetical protein